MKYISLTKQNEDIMSFSSTIIGTTVSTVIPKVTIDASL